MVVKITSGFSYSAQKNALYPGNTTHRIAAGTGKGILLLFIALISFPYRFSPIDTGLDPSWIFAINYFFDNNFIFGRDVIWTYGPLGFLSYPLNVGVNLDIATGFQVCLWFGFLFTIGYVALTNRCSSMRLLLFAVLCTGGQSAYYLGYVGFDYVIVFYILFLLSLSLFMQRWLGWYITALFLTLLLLFIKFSAAILSILSLLFFLFTLAFTDKRKSLKALIATVTLPVFFGVFFMMYHPSFSVMWGYIKGAYELVSGYSVAMSKPGKGIELTLAFIVAMLYGLCMFTLYQKKEQSFYLSGVFIAPLCFSFKHGFVRQDTHVLIFFSTVLLVIGMIMLFSDVRKFLKRAVCLTTAFIGVWFIVSLQHVPDRILYHGVAGLITVNNMKAAFQYTKTKALLDKTSEKNLEASELPEVLRKKTGTQRVAVFPWEVSYAAAQKLNYVPFPVFQTDNAYTSYLDLLNAQFLENPAAAPEFVLMEWKSVDDRHPLIDVPATWLSLCKWYDRYENSSALLLLKRRASPRFTRLHLIESTDYSTGDFVKVPTYEKPLVVKLHMDLHTAGKLTKIFFRIEEVRIALQTDSGGIHSFRVVPDTLRDGLLITVLPMNLTETDAFLSKKPGMPKINGFRIYGKGMSSYESKMTVEFYTADSNIFEIAWWSRPEAFWDRDSLQ